MRGFEWTDIRSEAEAAGATTVASAMVASGAQPTGDTIVMKAGGIDLLDLMKEGLLKPRRIMNLRSLSGLDRIDEDRDGAVRIGALVTLAQLSEHPLIHQRYAALADAARQSASPQIRNVATLGGNLLQRPRCWYFRSTYHHCARKGGATCFAFGGENQYHAVFDHDGCAIVHPSTVATALVALGAKIELAMGRSSNREVLLENFFLLPKVDLHRENNLRAGEILINVTLPHAQRRLRSVHIKQGEKDGFDWPIADVAVVLGLTSDGVCESASVVLGAAAPIPHRAAAAESALFGKRVDEQVARDAARAALSGAAPLTGNAYKLPIFETLVRRAIVAAAGTA